MSKFEFHFYKFLRINAVISAVMLACYNKYVLVVAAIFIIAKEFYSLCKKDGVI
jgi:hypothetical protein